MRPELEELRALTQEYLKQRGGVMSRKELEAMQWRDIESAPKDGTEIVIFDASKFGHKIPYRAAWHQETDVDDAAWIDVECEDNVLEATHWIPLPTLPKGEGHE